MEVKVIITPSPEMVSLVKSVMAVFTANNLVDKVQKLQEFSVQQKQPEFEAGGVTEKENSDQIVTLPTKPEDVVRKRKTKAEIEAEKLAQQELAKGIENAEKEGAEQAEETTAEEIVTEAPKTTFVADVVKLRKMTVRRSELIGDVPAKLLEFGYNSVTSLAKDAAAAEKYFNYLVSVSPISVEDNA